MAYGVKYQFSIEATNGDEVDIFLLQRDYSGQKHIRALGRAPILKRERNGCVLGTSLEIFAECRVDGEFAELYTSDAYEFKVEVYKRQTLQWTGFVSPELYAEPDIAPPYDVQIIATDGLGELKNYDFAASGRKSIMAHIRSLLQYTGLSLSYKIISDLQFDDDGGRVDAEEAFIGAVVDVDNLVGESSYDVLQKLLRSVGACITQQEGRWYLIRESDLYYRLEDIEVVKFGSMNSCDWWPVGNLNTDIMPAKNKIVITQENSYKDNILPAVAEGINGGWSLLGGVYYDRDEACNILPNEQSSMAYTLISADYPLRQPLTLTIKARCLTDVDGVANSRIGIKVAAKGGVATINASEFYLIYGKPEGYERYIPIWTAQSSGLGSSIVHSWEPPAVQFGDPDIEEIDIQIPLSDAGNGYYAYAYAEELEITIFNPSSDYPICVYECSLTQCHRPSGLELTANIGNNAREVYDDTEVMLASGDASLAVTMYGILVADGSITQWYSGNNSAESLLQLFALDIARQVALPRMRYRGKLNVPSMAEPVVPLLFFRDGTYYFLNTYSYDLLNDELEVELISIPNANVAIESETITEIASPGSVSGTGVGGSGVAGGGSGGTTLAGLSDVRLDSLQGGQILVYDSASGKWINKSGSVGGGSAVLESPVATDVAVGYIKKSYTLPEGMTFTEFVQMMFSQAVKKTLPSVTLGGVPTEAIEVGSEVTLSLSATYKDGQFVNTDEGVTSAGCEPGIPSYVLDGSTITIPHTFTASTAMMHSVVVTQPYGASMAEVKNSAGDVVDESIPAGTATASASFIVGYRAFWGYMTDDEAEDVTSELVRSLEHRDTIIDPTKSVVTLLNADDTVPAGQDLMIAIPSSYILSEVVNKDDINFAEGFVLSSLTVQCAGDAEASYNVYRYDNQSAYPMDIKKITIEEA